MNGMTPPVFPHADLLHPSRRLWKRVLPNCSQGTIETAVLALDRTGDIPGALAPDIWFSFLKTGDAAPLLGICDHNALDIFGLANLFAALTHIAAAPLLTWEPYRLDIEALALSWRDFAFKDPEDGESDSLVTSESLLSLAADRGHPRSLYQWGRDLLRRGRHEEGRSLLIRLASGDLYPPGLRAAAYRALAVDAEWRVHDQAGALAYTAAALDLGAPGEGLKRDLLGRWERLSQRRLSRERLSQRRHKH
jgi:hypothetical protein